MIDRVKVYRYRFKPGHGDDRRERIGVVAEELPDLVAAPDRKGAPTAELIALSLAADRALLDEVKQLRRRDREQQTRIDSLERRMESLARMTLTKGRMVRP